MTIDNELSHEGVIRRSGRYPWGSGENPGQRNRSFLQAVEALQKKGLTEKEVADGMGMTTTELRARKSVAKNELKKAEQARALKLKESGMSNVAIGQEMGINESSVRALLTPAAQQKADQLEVLSNVLRDEVDAKRYVQIGTGVENQLGVSSTRLKTAVQVLEDEGYRVHNFSVQQLGTGKDTTVKVLAAPDVDYGEVIRNKDKIGLINHYSPDHGKTIKVIEPPQNVSSKRIAINYAEDGGSDKDGVIELRRGVDDISLGNKRYAQVRIAVDGTHYLKGMAVYADDLPDGVDIRFNTNKNRSDDKLKAMKPLKRVPLPGDEKDKPTGPVDDDNPFGSIVSQRTYVDKNGKEKLSALNIVNEEGDWDKWSSNLSSQMLSKQTPQLAKKQLDIGYKIREDEYDEIMQLNNPVVRQHLLNKFADGADSAAVHLKAAGLPRTKSHVILPITSLKDDEVYAPKYKDGETVALIRHPHGGRFEIPELKVNNRNREAKRVMQNAQDAIGINPKVAQRLSGADFDGDTVLVIPNNNRLVKSAPALQGLKDFNPQEAYPYYEGMKVMSPKYKQQQMGDVSNLITDMTIKGATNDELARAVRHSMVVIDAEKHKLNYKQSAIDNNIKELKTKYQEGPKSGATTLISLAKSTDRIPEVKLRSAAEGGPVDKATGKLVYVPTGNTYKDRDGNIVAKTTKVTKLGNTDDAYTLSSGTVMEDVYANHSNKLKALANKARKDAVSTKYIPYSPSAKKTYAKEVSSLNAKLNVALQNKPLERQAQLIANTLVTQKRQANPDMDAAELKKIKSLALTEARTRVGAKKNAVQITQDEWNAIQAGAITTNKLRDILDNADIDQIKALATPRERTVMTSAKSARAKAMLNAGYTQAEIASALGVPTSTLNSALFGEEG